MKKQRSLRLFEQILKSDSTKKVYLQNINYFREYCKVKDFDSLLDIPPKKLQMQIEDYVIYLKGTISPNSIPTRYWAIQAFFEINDVMLNWKKIRRLFPAKVKKSGYAPWTTKDIQKMLEVATDVRSRALIHLVASTGVRIGAIQEMKLKHIDDIPLSCKSVLVYPDDPEEYYTFLTTEASSVLDRYLQKRKFDGEELMPESPVFRRMYKIAKAKAIPLGERGMSVIIQRLIKKAGLRSLENKTGLRYNIQQDHGFRKRFNTIMKLNNSINHNLVEKMMGHKRGLDGVYLTPTVEELFNEFQKAIPDLTVDDSERIKLEKKKLEQDKDTVEKQRIENEKLLNRLEEVQYGAEGRGSIYAKNMLKLKDDEISKMIYTVFSMIVELVYPEEKKREIFKKIQHAKQTGERIDERIFADGEGLTRAQKLAIIEKIANQPKKKSERKLPHFNLNLLESELITN